MAFESQLGDFLLGLMRKLAIIGYLLDKLQVQNSIILPVLTARFMLLKHRVSEQKAFRPPVIWSAQFVD